MKNSLIVAALVVTGWMTREAWHAKRSTADGRRFSQLLLVNVLLGLASNPAA